MFSRVDVVAARPPVAEWENELARNYEDIGCSLKIRSLVVRGRGSRPPARMVANGRRTLGFARRRVSGPLGAGVSGSLGASARHPGTLGFARRESRVRSARGARVRSARGFRSAWASLRGRVNRPGRTEVNEAEPKADARVRSAPDWLRSAPGLGFVRRRVSGSLGRSDRRPAPHPRVRADPRPEVFNRAASPASGKARIL
jgi:hypothetical protein